VVEQDEVMLVSASGQVTRVKADSVPLQGRRTQGRRVVKLASGDRIVEVTRVQAEGEEPRGGPGGSGPGAGGLEEGELAGGGAGAGGEVTTGRGPAPAVDAYDGDDDADGWPEGSADSGTQLDLLG